MKCQVQMTGPGPSETIVTVTTISGKVELVVDVDSIKKGNVNIGDLLQVESVVIRNGNTLVELPRESVSGQTRVWVPTAETVQESAIL